MATRTALLNGNVINRDTDFSKHIEAVSEPGVISGFAVSSSSVAVGQALVKCERTNGDIIYAVVYNNSAQEISGNGDVFIEIAQELIDNGELMNEDGTGIAEIKVGTMPSKNALKLATKSGNTITDARNMIKKSGELLALINQNIEDISDLDSRVEHLEEVGAINHLEEAGLVGEKYTLANTLFKQLTPTFANSTVDCNVGDLTANTAIHIQRIANGTASNKLKLKVKKIGSPTTGLVVEVRRGVQVDVSDTEAYWYGNELVCSGSIAYSAIDTTYAEIEVTMSGQFGGTKGELLDIVVYQTGSIVNSTNYYAIACDSTQESEGFSLVAVNGNTRTRSKLMPYCISDGLIESLLCKTYPQTYTSLLWSLTGPSGASDTKTYTTTQTYDKFYIKFTGTYSGMNYANSESFDIKVSVNNVEKWTRHRGRTSGTQMFNELCELSNVPSGATISIYVSEYAPYSNISYGNMQCLATIPGNLVVIVRKLIPNEVKSLGQQATAISYGQLSNGQRYGEFSAETSSSATTGNITLGNCAGFKTIIDNLGNKWKVPVYKE